MKSMLMAATAALFVVAPATAQTVDGNLDAAYGAPKATVLYDPAAPTGNFQFDPADPINSPGPQPVSNAVGYDIYLSSDANNVYGFFQAKPGLGGSAVGAFANLYFDLNPPVMDGSDLGFEIGASGITAFIPGRNGQPGFNTVLDPSLYSVFASGNVVEVALSNSLFTGAIPTLIYYPGQTFPGAGDAITLRISQTFGYSAAGGATYGPDRLGAITIGGNADSAVPEPATWAMMIAGFGLVGGAMRRRKVSVAFA